MISNRGVTLIEVLIAIIIMAIGLVGILALFPVATQTSKESMDETTAAILADSIKQALTVALRFAQFGSTGASDQYYYINMTHDLLANNQRNLYSMRFPQISTVTGPVWTHFPGTSGGAPATPDIGKVLAATPVQDQVFVLSADPWVAQTVKLVQGQADPGEPYETFAFSFDTWHMWTYYSATAPDKDDVNSVNNNRMNKIFQFRLHIFRVKRWSIYDPDTNTRAVTPSLESLEHIATLTCMISAQ